MDEQQIIAHLKQGDIAVLGLLVERYQLKALRAAYLVTQDRALAEDVVQNAFLNAYHGIRHFDSARPFAPWFMRSVVNAAVQASQRQGRIMAVDPEALDVFEAQLASPDEAAEANDLRERLQIALEHLSPDQRATIVLRYYLEMSELEISNALDRPLGTIKWRLHQAKRQLRLLLGQP